MNRTDGALVRLTTQISPSESEEDADQRLQAFMHDALPKLAAYLPAVDKTREKAADNKPRDPQS
jgi:hypothetical protein